MKKFSFFVIALLVSATTIAQKSLPSIYSDKDASGKYGYVQDGKEIIPHIFDYASSFYDSKALSYVLFQREYYVIDRNGNIVDENNPNRSYYPTTYSRYAIVDRKNESGLDSDAGVVVDANGNRLIHNYYASPINIFAHDGDSYHLFSLTTDRDIHNTQLANIKGEVIIKNIRGYFAPLGRGLIKYTNPKTSEEGVYNCYGEVLVPCQYKYISFYSFDDLYYKEKKALRKAGVLDKYNHDQLKTIGFIVARNGRYVTLYDQCGNKLTPTKEYKKIFYANIVKKYRKKVIIPHFSRKGAILHELKQRVINPNIARQKEYNNVVNNLPVYSSNKTNIVSHIKHLEANPKLENFSYSECYSRGKAYYDKNKYTEAIPWLLRAAEGKYSAAYRKLADSYNNTQNYQQAWNWYGSCVGGDGCNPNSADYQVACMVLSSMFKDGRGCDQNYDSAIHFMREFRKYTHPLNYANADKDIAELIALKNKANPQRQQVASNSSTAVRTTSSSSGSRPSYGSIPTGTDIYMKSADKNKYTVMKLNFFMNNGDYILRVNGGGPGLMYKLNQTTSDSYIFQSCREVTSWGGGFNSLRVSYQVTMDDKIVIAKDWSSVISNAFESINGKKYLTLVASKAEYDQFQKAVSNMVNYFEGISGGGGGGSVVPAQIESGMSAAYYQDMYRKYESLAESAYNSLTATGISVEYSDGSHSGSAAGRWKGSNYSQMKSELTKAQSEMRRIRSEAARAGHTITQSRWESATVTY